VTRLGPAVLRDALRIADLLAESLLAFGRGDKDAGSRLADEACAICTTKSVALRMAWSTGAVPKPGTPGWTAHLDQLRAELADAERATGDST
jgi:hypothetical protein